MKRLKGSHRGFSFIELSVATAVFSMGLGSLSLMMLAAVQGTAEARHHTVATSQADSMAEMIAMSADAYGHYVFPPDSELVPCDEGSCRGETMATENTAFWQEYLRGELPGGGGLVCRDSTPDDGNLDDPSCDGSGSVVIKVFWEEPRHRNAEGGELRRVISRLPW
jgi:type IV pilus assembly protein PilV